MQTSALYYVYKTDLHVQTMQSVHDRLGDWWVLNGCVCVRKRERLLVIWVTDWCGQIYRDLAWNLAPKVHKVKFLPFIDESVKRHTHNGYTESRAHDFYSIFIHPDISRLNLLECFVGNSYMSLDIFFYKVDERLMQSRLQQFSHDILIQVWTQQTVVL